MAVMFAVDFVFLYVFFLDSDFGYDKAYFDLQIMGNYFKNEPMILSTYIMKHKGFNQL